MRLNHFLARAGLGSRRSVEELVFAGRVTVNGLVLTDPARDVQPGDRVELDGEPVVDRAETAPIYILYHKPVGVVSTLKLGRERGPCIADVVHLPERVFPVGRLDRDTSGLLLLTNDGDLAFRLMHPKFGVEKEYLVKTARPLHPRQWERLMRGVGIDKGLVVPDIVEPAAGGRIRLVIHEGRKHIVRRLFREIKATVVELKRVRVGRLSLGRLGVGKWRKLKINEVKMIATSSDIKMNS